MILLAGAVFLYKERFSNWPWQKAVSLPQGQVASDQNWENKEPRQIIMEDVAARIGELSPEKPVLGGNWYVSRFWFIDGFNNTFYVEYEDGHIMRKLLLVADMSSGQDVKYTQKAFFEPGESDWILKSGKDLPLGQHFNLYSFNQTAGQWVLMTK